jgi:hypothetical protein
MCASQPRLNLTSYMDNYKHTNSNSIAVTTADAVSEAITTAALCGALLTFGGVPMADDDEEETESGATAAVDEVFAVPEDDNFTAASGDDDDPAADGVADDDEDDDDDGDDLVRTRTPK